MTESDTPIARTPAPLPTSPKRRRGRSIILGIVLLLCGAIIGGGLTLVVAVRRVQYAIHHPNEFPAHAAARLRRQLKLSDDQTRSVEEILRERQTALQAIRREVQPRVEAQLDETQREVAAVLTPEQADKWNHLMTERRRTWLPPPPPPEQTPSTEPAKK